MATRDLIAMTAAVTLTVGPALLAGKYLNRWGIKPDLGVAAEQVVKFPTEFGSWQTLRNGEPLAEEVCEELGLAGYISRQYTNRSSGAIVNMLLMVGQPGPLLRHPPNICYANRANRQVGEMTSFDVDARESKSEFTAIEYEPPDALVNEHFLVAFSMSTGTDWSVPQFPRLKFGAASKLYKVQMLTAPNRPQDRTKGIATLKQFASDFCLAFLRQTGEAGPANANARVAPVTKKEAAPSK
jgi:Protein of unknown function (DUF3485)